MYLFTTLFLALVPLNRIAFAATIPPSQALTSDLANKYVKPVDIRG